MTEQKFEPVATLHDDGHYTYHAPKPHGYNYAGWKEQVFTAAQMEAFWLLGHKEGAGCTAAQMRQARIQALEEAVDAVPVVMDHEAYKAAVTAIRALIEQESK